MKILFVCTGNSCRSPMASVIAREIFKSNGLDIEVDSKGISVLMALPASENAINCMKNAGLDLSEHVTRQISRDDILKYDLILTMTKRHKEYLCLQAQDAVDKITPIYEFAAESNKDVADPFGKELSVYEECANELRGLIEKIAKKLAEPSDAFKKKKSEVKMIAIGCDHAGYELKKGIVNYLKENDITFTDFGTDSDKAVDYPVYAKKVAEAILNGSCKKGILVCGTGIGISIAANRIKGIRAALCGDVFSAKSCRLHNDANILALGGRVVGEGHALEILKAFLETDFSGEARHKKRVKQIDSKN